MKRLYGSTAVVAIIGLGGLLAGCSTEMEDGYTPRNLNAGPTQRRAYYASPFTPEAEAAKQEKNADNRSMRPSMGGY